MADDTNDTTEVAAQNQVAAGATIPNSPSASATQSTDVDANAGAISTSSPSMTSATSATQDGTALNAGATDVGESSTSTPAAVLGAASTLSGAASTAGGTDPNVNAAASTSSVTPTTPPPATEGNAAAVKANTDFINDPATQQASLAGTSGKMGNTTGMAFEAGTLKVSPKAAAQVGANAGVDTNVNVKYPNAAHPIVHEVQKRTSELRNIIDNVEQSVWVQRALKDLQAFDDWIVQHFEEMKRKGK